MKKLQKRLIITGITLGALSKFLTNPKLEDKLDIGKWYKVSPDGGVNADGSKWHGLIKVQDTSKVLIYFYGGGLSIDSFTASHDMDYLQDGFYYARRPLDGLEHFGITSSNHDNPFKDYTILLIPYATGDMHVGNNEYHYKDVLGKEKVLYHYGYSNFIKYMDMVLKYLKDTKRVVIAGYSAGGFAVSMLMPVVREKYFPGVLDFSLLIDASLLITDKWSSILKDVWNSPEDIRNIVKSDNLILDSIKNVKDKYPDTKVMFVCSNKDNILTKYQNYLDNGEFETTSKAVSVFESNLKSFLREYSKLDKCYYYIWNNNLGLNDKVTQHTIIASPQFYIAKYNNKETVSTWVSNIINDEVVESIVVED